MASGVCEVELSAWCRNRLSCSRCANPLFTLSPQPAKTWDIVFQLIGILQAVSPEPAHTHTHTLTHTRVHKQFPPVMTAEREKHSSVKRWRCPEGLCVCVREERKTKESFHSSFFLPDETVDTISCNPSSCSAGDTVPHAHTHTLSTTWEIRKLHSCSDTLRHQRPTRVAERGQVDYIRSWVLLQVMPCHLQGCWCCTWTPGGEAFCRGEGQNSKK